VHVPHFVSRIHKGFLPHRERQHGLAGCGGWRCLVEVWNWIHIGYLLLHAHRKRVQRVSDHSPREPVSFQFRNVWSVIAPRARRARPWAVYQLRDDRLVPLICPTCQNVFAGKASMPASPLFVRGSLLCMGLFSMFLLGAGPARPPGDRISFIIDPERMMRQHRRRWLSAQKSVSIGPELWRGE
jgi:hypothetical protein